MNVPPTGVVTGAPGAGEGPGAAAGAPGGCSGRMQETTVVDALRALRPEHREVLAETWLRGCGIAEAAQARGVPAALLTERLHEALRALAGAQGGRQEWDAGAHVGVGAYLLRLLDPDSERVFSEHMTSCPGCRSELTGLAPVVVMLTHARTQVDRSRPTPRAARAMAPAPDCTPPRGFPRPDGVPADPRPALRPAAAPSDGSHGVPVGAPLGGPRTGPIRTPTTVVARRVGRSGRRQGGRPRLLLPVTATVALLAAGGAAGADDLWLVPAPGAAPRSGVSGGASDGVSGQASDTSVGVRRAEVTDPRSGVSVEVEADPNPPGTSGSRVSVSLTGLTGPRSCRLVAVRRDGATQVLATWQVPASGYGTPDQPDPFTLAVIATPPVTELDGMQVESVGSGGRSTVLVRVPF